MVATSVVQPISGTVTTIGSSPVTSVTLVSTTVTQPVSGTIATNADASINAGTAPAKAIIVGGKYNAASPTLTNAQTIALQQDINGNLLVSGFVSLNTQTITLGASTITQAVSGIVTTMPSGTQVVSGSVSVSGVTLNAAASVTLVGTSVTQPVSGTVATTADGSVNAATAPSTARVAALVYNTISPTLTSGQSVALQGDIYANLRTRPHSIYNTTPPSPSVGQPVVFQGDSQGNLKVNVAAGSVTVLPSGTQNISVVGTPNVAITSGTITSVPSGTQIADVITPIGTVLRAVIAVSSAGISTLVGPTTGHSNRVLSLFAVSAGQQNFYFASSTANLCGTSACPIILPANGSGFELVDNRIGWFESGINNAITISLVTATTMGGCINYISV